MSPASRIPEWAATAVGGHDVRATCVLELPAEAAERLVQAVGEGLARIGFTPLPLPEAAGDVVALQRGSRFGDLVLDGTSLGLRRIGPLTYRGVVLLERTPSAQGQRVVLSLVIGATVAPDFARVVDAAVTALAEAGIPAEGPGWMRAVDVPEDSVGNPATAVRELHVR